MVKTSNLLNTEVIKAYRNVLIPSITYPLGAVYFTPEQCNSLQHHAAQSYLPKLGFNRKLPKPIVFGPSKYGGWGERDLFIHMTIQQTKLLLGHMRNGDETGKLLTTDLEYTQIYSSIDTPILHRTTPPHFL